MCIATNTAHAKAPITINTPAQYGTVLRAKMSRPCPLMEGGMIRCPSGWEYVYRRGGGLVNGGSVGETSITESCGDDEAREVCGFEGGVGLIRGDEVGCDVPC